MAVDIVSYAASRGAGGKFVVLVAESDPDAGVMVFSDFTRDFQHVDIVRRWERAGGKSVSASGYRVAGGGWWRFEGETLVVYGRSAAFGRFDPEWARSRLRAGTVMGESRIDVL